jgi:DNA-binding IscR family transcriptional regulator
VFVIDDFILGNALLHDRFGLATAIVGRIVSSAPKPVTLNQLEKFTGRLASELEELCARLSSTGMLRPDAYKVDAWTLGCAPEDASLEDVFRCLLAEQFAHRTPPGVRRDSCHEVDLLMMQMTIAINQGIFRHLRRFTLDRLKRGAGVMLPWSSEEFSARAA